MENVLAYVPFVLPQPIFVDLWVSSSPLDVQVTVPPSQCQFLLER